jgi:hypothetical protein
MSRLPQGSGLVGAITQREDAAWPPPQSLDDDELEVSVRALGTFPGISLPPHGN